jgi:hypothetical protein
MIAMNLRTLNKCSRSGILLWRSGLRQSFSSVEESKDIRYYLKDPIIYKNPRKDFQVNNGRIVMASAPVLSAALFWTHHPILGFTTIGGALGYYLIIAFVRQNIKLTIKELKWDPASELLTIFFFDTDLPLIAKLDDVRFDDMMNIGEKHLSQPNKRKMSMVRVHVKDSSRKSNGAESVLNLLIDEDAPISSSKVFLMALLSNDFAEVRKFENFDEKVDN